MAYQLIVIKSQVSAYWNAQQQAYLQPGSAGWFMWTLKMEDGGIWSLESCYTQVTDASLCYIRASDDMSRARKYVQLEKSMDHRPQDCHGRMPQWSTKEFMPWLSLTTRCRMRLHGPKARGSMPGSGRTGVRVRVRV